MNKLIAALNFVLSVFFIAALIMIVYDFPSAINKYSTEPEDVYILLFLLVASFFMSVISIMNILNVLEKFKFSWITLSRLKIANLIMCATLLFGAILGFTSTEVSVKEFRILILPSLIFALSTKTMGIKK